MPLAAKPAKLPESRKPGLAAARGGATAGAGGEQGRGRGLQTSRSLNLQTRSTADAADEPLHRPWCAPPVALQGSERSWMPWARSDRPGGPKPAPVPTPPRPSARGSGGGFGGGYGYGPEDPAYGLAVEGPPSTSSSFSSTLSHSTWRRAQPPPQGNLGRSPQPYPYASSLRGAPSPGFSASRSAGRAADRAASSPLPGYCPAPEYHVITREQTHAFHSSLMEASLGGGSVLTKINMKR